MPNSADGDADRERRWYACYTRGRHEKSVDRLLRQRGFESFLPLVTRQRRWHDRVRDVEFPLFPSYVFARFDLGSLHAVLDVPGLASVVRFGGEPAPVPERELDNIRCFATALAGTDLEPKPVEMLRKGQAVRVVSGPLEGVEGVVAEQRGAGRALVVVGVRAIGQGLKLEVESEALEVVP